MILLTMPGARPLVRSLTTVTVVSIAAIVSAQCGMTTDLMVLSGCYSTTVVVNTSGGTAPYSISVDRRPACSTNWWNTHSYSNDPDGDLNINLTFGATWEGAEYGRVTVTDALGCIATYTTPAFTAPWYPVVYPGALFSTELDCASGLHRLLMNTSQGAMLMAYYNYSLDGASTLPIAGHWTAVGGITYRSNFTVSPGTHSLSLTTPGSIPSGCGGVLTACFQSESISVPTAGVSPGDCGANVAVRIALQGPLPTGTTVMHDSLRTRNLLPTTEPYTSLGYSYTAYAGTTTLAPSLLAINGNNAIVDWVVVELRNSANSAQVLFSKPALLQRDGDVVDLDGDGYVNFPSAGGSYYVALRHRNHLGVMTSTTRNLGVAPLTVDLRLSSTTCYGTAPRVGVGSVQCLWPGNANGDNVIGYTGADNDRDVLLQAIGGVLPTNTLNNVYDRRDVNMDGTVKYTGTANDRDVILQTIGGSVPTNTRVQQLP